MIKFTNGEEWTLQDIINAVEAEPGLGRGALYRDGYRCLVGVIIGADHTSPFTSVRTLTEDSHGELCRMLALTSVFQFNDVMEGTPVERKARVLAYIRAL